QVRSIEGLDLQSADRQRVVFVSAIDTEGNRYVRGRDGNRSRGDVARAGETGSADAGFELPSTRHGKDKCLVVSHGEVAGGAFRDHDVAERGEGGSVGRVERLVSQDIVASHGLGNGDIGPNAGGAGRD